MINRNMMRFLKQVIALCISAGIILYLIERMDALAVLRALKGTELAWSILALLVTATSPVLGALWWWTIVLAIGCNISFNQSLRVTLAAFPSNTFLPSKAGDLSKAAFLKERGGFVPLAGSVIFERLIDVAVLSVISVLGSILLGYQTGLLLSSLCALPTGFGFSYFLKKVVST